MNAVAGLADPDLGGIPFFSANLLDRPASLRHGDWDYGSSHGRLLDAAVLARHMTGADDFLDSERGYLAGLLGFLGEDGLTYRRAHPRGHWAPNDRQIAALARIAVREREAWFYPASEYTTAGWPSSNAVDLKLAPDPASFSGRLIMPLLRYHQATGNADALELCARFARLITRYSGVFNEDGSFSSALAYRSGHFHTRLGTLDGLARYGVHTGDHALTAFVRRSYDWALGQATSFGWTPGDLADQRFEHESCSLVDLISIAITLAKAGYPRYWQVAERFLRNHLTESQLRDLDWVESAPDRSADERGWVTYYRVADRVRGAFAGYGAPNDVVSDGPLGRGHTSDVQACCVGSGVRGLFLGWNAVVTEVGGLPRVNLLLSRAHRLLDVTSWLPHAGRIDLDVHQDRPELRVRVPGWAGYAKVVTRRQGSVVPTAWAADGYLSVAGPRAGERITIEFPVATSTMTDSAAGQEFVTRWRGDDVTGITPEGTVLPMYSGRSHDGPVPPRPDRRHRPAREWDW
jgi:hypothetical protein